MLTPGGATSAANYFRGARHSPTTAIGTGQGAVGSGAGKGHRPTSGGATACGSGAAVVVATVVPYAVRGAKGGVTRGGGANNASRVCAEGATVGGVAAGADTGRRLPKTLL